MQSLKLIAIKGTIKRITIEKRKASVTQGTERVLVDQRSSLLYKDLNETP